MSKDTEKSQSGSDDSDYQIGYGRPPMHTRFQAGQSGNPRGRRKGVRTLKTDVKRTLKVPVKVNDAGRSRKISTQEGALMVLREKALKGDARALDGLLELARLFNDDPSEIGPTQVLAADDQKILDNFRAETAAEIATATTTPGTGENSGVRPINPESDPSKEEPK